MKPFLRLILSLHGVTQVWPVDSATSAAGGIDVTSLDDPRACPALRNIIGALARRTQDLLAVSRPFAGRIRDGRLALEVAVIQTFAEDLARTLTRRDPLSERVHHGKGQMLALALLASLKLVGGAFR